MNLYHIKLTDNQKDALERLFNMGIVWNKTELSDAWEQLREQVREASCTVAIINAIRNSECNCKKPADPCRKFKNGDIVEPRKGREVYACEWEDCCFHKMDGKYEVQGDEKEGHVSVIDKETGIDCYVSAFALELVTPVKDREPYYVSTNIDCSTCTIFKRAGEKKLVHSAYYFVHGKGCSNAILSITEAQAAAATECDRLNKEYREEMEK